MHAEPPVKRWHARWFCCRFFLAASAHRVHAQILAAVFVAGSVRLELVYMTGEKRSTYFIISFMLCNRVYTVRYNSLGKKYYITNKIYFAMRYLILSSLKNATLNEGEKISSSTIN